MPPPASRRGDLTFYLGTHLEKWLETSAVPLCVARQRFDDRNTMPRAACRWMLDSGAFSELQRFGQWTVSAERYAALVRRIRDEVGGLDWAAPQDWMCEESIVKGGTYGGQKFAGTGLTVARHHELTVDNLIELRTLAPDLPFRLVLQGDRPDDYLRHAEMYERRGIALADEPVIGIGSVCRLQATGKADWIVRSLWPLRLHGFGVKTNGLMRYGNRLTSADSLAWSYNARRNPWRLPDCTHRGSCSNCLNRALWWRGNLLRKMALLDDLGLQDGLFDGQWELAGVQADRPCKVGD